MKIIYGIALFLFLVLIVACNKKTETLACNFNKANGIICRVDITKYDLLLDVTSSITFNHDEHLEFSFKYFNYGGDIRLFNGCRDDMYATSLGKVVGIYKIPADKIYITENFENKKYGKWAFAVIRDIDMPMSKIVVTPLAYKEIMENDSSTFVLVVFHENQNTMKVLFNAEPTILLCLKQIVSSFNESEGVGHNGLVTPGKFWFLDL